MISHEPFYKTLAKKDITQYQLLYKHGFSANILHRMKHGKNITLKTLDTLCFILDCPISDIIEYSPDKQKVEKSIKVPSITVAEQILGEAEQINPGLWVYHCKVAAYCAKTIASRCEDVDADASYVLGLLHDIGRRIGVCDLKHVIAGYRFMLSENYEDSAKICLTHSFPYKDILAFAGKNDISPEDTLFLTSYIENAEYDDYDKLIQLCDALAYPTGPCIIEKRLIDVTLRRGVNSLSVEKWRAYFGLREYFENKIGTNLYSLFPELILQNSIYVKAQR